jgi:hypothetical protein
MISIAQIFSKIDLRLAKQCNHNLLRGPCVHVRGHARYSRHSHTWQMGDARYENIDGKLIDMETGEVMGITSFNTGEIVDSILTERATYGDAEKLANARRVLRLYGIEVPDDICIVVIERGSPMLDNVNWDYHGTSGWSYGQDSDGHNYERSPDGKAKRIYSLSERQNVVTMASRIGAARAGRACGIPSATVRSWAKRAA